MFDGCLGDGRWEQVTGKAYSLRTCVTEPQSLTLTWVTFPTFSTLSQACHSPQIEALILMHNLSPRKIFDVTFFQQATVYFHPDLLLWIFLYWFVFHFLYTSKRKRRKLCTQHNRCNPPHKPFLTYLSPRDHHLKQEPRPRPRECFRPDCHLETQCQHDLTSSCGHLTWPFWRGRRDAWPRDI